MKKILIILIAIFTLTSCNSTVKEEVNTDNQQKNFAESSVIVRGTELSREALENSFSKEDPPTSVELLSKVDINSISEFGDYYTIEQNLFSEYYKLEQESFSEYYKLEQESFSEYYKISIEGIKKFRLENKTLYLEWLDAKELGNYDLQRNIENSPEYLKSQEKAKLAYNKYKKDKDSLYSKYKTIKKTAYQEFKEKKQIAYQAYKSKS